MSSTTDKLKGAANDAMGKAKEGAGRVVNDDEMKAEGLAQQAKGKTQKTVGEAKDSVKRVVDKA
jgi:uncharacterized protein YjbJ (UPF0337 family)